MIQFQGFSIHVEISRPICGILDISPGIVLNVIMVNVFHIFYLIILLYLYKLGSARPLVMTKASTF